PQFDVLRASVQVANDLQTQTVAESNATIALANLVAVLGIDPETRLQLAPLPVTPLPPPLPLGPAPAVPPPGTPPGTAPATPAPAANVQQAQEALRIAQVRYRAGVATSVEVTDAQVALTQA